MATTSEIKITEAYIGLLGRAPDPDGLKYWADALDAAGGTDVALKKLTKDITLSAEWASGLGSNDTSTRAGADAVVKGQFNNLFGYDPSQADYDYYSPKLMAGEFTASSMVVVLIQGADTTDAATLALKQEAATYYVETIAQSDFNTTNATAAVSGVVSPITLKASKEATDALATGVGSTLSMTTTNGETIAMTQGSDTVTAAAGTMQENDVLADPNANDSDTLTITETSGFTFGTVSNVESIAVNLAAQKGADFTIDANNVSGGSITVDVADEVKVAGLDVKGETEVVLQNAASDVSTVDVTALTLSSMDKDISLSGDASLATVTLIGANDAGTSVTLANNDSTVNLGGLDGTNDTVSVSAVGKVTIDTNDGTNAVTDITVSGNGGAVVATFNDNDPTKFATTGSQDVTLKGAAAAFTGTTFASTNTGNDTLDITTGGALDLTKWAAIDSLTLSAAMGANTITYAAGQLDVTVSATQNDNLVFETNDTTAASTNTLTLTLNNDVDGIATGTTEANDFDTITINTGAKTRTIDDIDVDGNDSVLTLIGTNDVTVTNEVEAGGVTVNISGAFATDDVGATSELISITADSVAIGNDVVAENDSITITATNDVSVDDVTINNESGTDDVTITGKTITANDIAGASNVILDATNDTAASVANDVAAEGKIDVNGGSWTFASLDANDGAVTITGATTVTVTGTTDATAGVTITSSCDVDLGTMGQDAGVVNASTATGAITLFYNDTDSSYSDEAFSVETGSGNDALTLNDADGAFTVNSGDGLDTITVTNAGTGTVINAGGGVDTINADDTGNDYTVGGGAGNDNIIVAASAAPTVQGGDGNDTITLSGASNSAIDGGNDTDTLVLAAQNYSGGTATFSNIEKVDITAGSATISAAQFANESTFELIGAGAEVLTITQTAATAVTIDASGVTTDGFAQGELTITGAAGDDILTASNYADIVNGEGGNDTINGGSQLGGGNDVLNGNDGKDTIIGNAGNDIITGGNDADTMTGGTGTDTFVFVGNTGQETGNDAANNADVITDFVTGTDKIDLSAASGAGGLLADNDGVQIVLSGTANGIDDYDDALTAANTYFASSDTSNDVYVAVNAFDSGNSYVFIDADDDNDIDDADFVIILTGLNDVADIAAGDFTGIG